MVKFGRSVFYLFSCMVKYPAVRFSIYLAVWIRPYGQVRPKFNNLKKYLQNVFILVATRLLLVENHSSRHIFL